MQTTHFKEKESREQAIIEKYENRLVQAKLDMKEVVEAKNIYKDTVVRNLTKE